MDINSLKQMREHFEHFGNTVPLPQESIFEIFDLAEAFLNQEAKPTAKKTKVEK